MNRLIQIRQISAADTRPLRAAILRPHHPAEESVYPLDDHPDSRHFGAFIDDLLIGTASLLHQPATSEPLPANDDPAAPWMTDRAWRLRGMTVIPEHRGASIGARLFNALIDHARSQRGTCLWFNARDTAIGFYRRLGCEGVGQPRELPGHGAYLFMWRSLNGLS